MVIQAFCMSRETAYHAINQLVNRPSNELAPFEALDTEEQLQFNYKLHFKRKQIDGNMQEKTLNTNRRWN